jgi:hypothetical protein
MPKECQVSLVLLVDWRKDVRESCSRVVWCGEMKVGSLSQVKKGMNVGRRAEANNERGLEEKERRAKAAEI